MAWSDCLLNPVSCVIDNTAGSAATSVWDSFLRWAAGGLTEITAVVFKAFSSSTSPRFDQQWWTDNLGLMVAISLPLLVGLFVLQCVSAVVRREPGGLGRALVGVLIGTAGVPLAVAIVASCGRAVDEISLAILGNRATADGLKRMIDLSVVLSVGTLGGYMLVAVFLGLVATISLYVVMLLRDVAIVALVAFAPLAMVGWTWSATRAWLRGWVEIVGALVASKIPMSVVFVLGISATGNGGSTGGASIGTFLAGVLLLAMAALAPMATFSFIHWAGDQGQAVGHALRQGLTGASTAKEKHDQVQQWRADHFGTSGEPVSGSIVGGDADEDSGDSTVAGWTEDDLGGDESPRSSTRPGADSRQGGSDGNSSGTSSSFDPNTAPSGLDSPEASAAGEESRAEHRTNPVGPPEAPNSNHGDSGDIATTIRHVSTDGSGAGDTASDNDEGGDR